MSDYTPKQLDDMPVEMYFETLMSVLNKREPISSTILKSLMRRYNALENKLVESQHWVDAAGKEQQELQYKINSKMFDCKMQVFVDSIKGRDLCLIDSNQLSNRFREINRIFTYIEENEI